MADAAADDEAVRRRTAATGSTGAGGSGRAADDRDPDLWAPIDTPDPAPPDAEPYRIVATPIPAAEPGVDERSDPQEGDPLDGSADRVADGDLAHPGPDAATPGYPACPDHTEKGTLFALLGAEEGAGMGLTESFAMTPASSVSGWYFAHPEARYFGLGKIGRDQLADYAKRKGWTLDEAERWLSPNLE